nr:ATP-binding cassette domain-containing protein [Enterocloster clostridioformis]
MGNSAFLSKKINTELDRLEEVTNIPKMDTITDKLNPANYEISLKDVSFGYGSRKIIENISLNIPEHTTCAIVGPSGSGKTTLCSLIARFWDVQEGSVCIGGQNVKNYTADSVLDCISMVFQKVYLFHDTIENNIKFGNPKATLDEVMEAAKRACCHDFIMALPDGYQTVIGESGSTLSGGEKQRISIARAILKDAPIVILDEATSSGDPENEQALLSAIEELTKNKTLISIAHRLSTVQKADQIIVIDNGQIRQKGTHKQLSQEDGIYRNFLKLRVEATGWQL